MFFRVANFRQFLELLEQHGQHSEQKICVQARHTHPFFSAEDVDHTFAADCRHKVADVEYGLAEKRVGAPPCQNDLLHLPLLV